MKYELTHLDAKNIINTFQKKITLCEFVKHVTFAGINSLDFWENPFRYASSLFEFIPSFLSNEDYFIRHPALKNDPTETAYMSNRIGRAFADLFSKNIYGARFTHSYECAMMFANYDLIEQRPDFYCDTLVEQFAVEAKGYSSSYISGQQMSNHKDQSQTGPLPIHFSVASVAYSLYESPKINFYDPVGDKTNYNHDLNRKLRRAYYNKAIYLINLTSTTRKESKITDYYSYEIKKNFLPPMYFLVHKGILESKYENIEWLSNSETLKTRREENFYIDSDGIGIWFDNSNKNIFRKTEMTNIMLSKKL